MRILGWSGILDGGLSLLFLPGDVVGVRDAKGPLEPDGWCVGAGQIRGETLGIAAAEGKVAAIGQGSFSLVVLASGLEED